ncbi:MAG: HAMP domain-containing histidine kinase [Phycisphaerales bacterium]|nr:HAMP domain-containing histidine kinase [Planctomycetota bacterium]MCH8509064.1 HAMP domain-containing histidine kinase [Phycisphaerales bacterium]
MSRLEDIRAWYAELSLATKCLLLFGGASAGIIAIALSLPLLRMNSLVDAPELAVARTVYASWVRVEGDAAPASLAGASIRSIPIEAARAESENSRFLRRALRQLDPTEESRGTATIEYFDADWSGWTRVHRYARARRGSDGVVRDVVVIERRADGAARNLLINFLYVLAAGSVVLAVALVVFAALTSRLILRPVLSLQRTAERVREGHLDTRSHIDTGDEFEELAETINLMLAELQRQQDQLRSANVALDSRLTELTEANTALFESARLKGEFLASVSHELRTPLNAIIGFAELLLEIARSDIATSGEGRPIVPGPDALAKRERYLVNIVSAGRTLLEMIESLLEMAKIEAGRVEIRPGVVQVSDACQALVGLIHPLARKKEVEVTLDLPAEPPVIETDPKKLNQIVFNLLSNAVKFSGGQELGRPGKVILRIERLSGGDDDDRVRVSVIDNGPGIAPEDQKRIFDKFQQVDSSHTRAHAGTGLGLAIVAELTRLLQGEVQLESELGQGSMFSVILPMRLDMQAVEEAKLEAKFRGSLAPSLREPARHADEPGTRGGRGAGGA